MREPTMQAGKKIMDALQHGPYAVQGFIEAVLRDHNTRQQQAVGGLLSALKAVAENPFTDGRNEYAAKICKAALKAVDEADIIAAKHELSGSVMDGYRREQIVTVHHFGMPLI
jgi:hypothetical protein